MKLLKTLAVLLVIVVVFSAAMVGINLHTGPLIEANNAGAALAPLLAVMPEGAAFDGEALLYSTENPGTLADVPAQVLTIYKEATGMGYAVQCQTVGNYEATPMTLTFGVSADGKIAKVQVDNYTDSIDVREKDPNFLPSFDGKDSALADVNLVAGCTYSSKSIKEAVEAGLNALISNGLIAEGVKSPAQILTEMIPTVHTGMAVNGTIKGTEVTPSGNIVSGYAAENGTGYAFVMAEGENNFLAVVNAMGVCKVVDVEGNDVTADKAALADEAVAAAALTDYAEAANTKFGKMFEGAADITAVPVDSFSSVVYAASFTVDGVPYYGFYARPIGFEVMDIYVVIDATGAIAKLDAKALFFETEYFVADDNVDAAEYKGAFTGMTVDTFTGENTVVAGATMTSDAVKAATDDAFAANSTLPVLEAAEAPAVEEDTTTTEEDATDENE